MTNQQNAPGHTMAQRMLDAAICAYDVLEDKSFNPSSTYWDPVCSVGPFTPLLSGSDDINAGFVTTTADNWVVLSLRGTLSQFDSWDTFMAYLKDWLQDDETSMVHWDFGNHHLGLVEKGFLAAMTSLWPQIEAALKSVDWSNVQGIQITGHSKGAAMTSLAAAMVSIAFPLARKIQVHAFAAPQAGDPQFAAWYKNNRLDAVTTRYLRRWDMVPFLPATADWDIFDHMWGRTLEGIWLVASLDAFGKTLTSGYEALGSVVYLPGNPPQSGKPIVGKAAIEASRESILYATGYGHGEDIMHAHSAKCSYWPALFQTKSCDPLCK